MLVQQRQKGVLPGYILLGLAERLAEGIHLHGNFPKGVGDIGDTKQRFFIFRAGQKDRLFDPERPVRSVDHEADAMYPALRQDRGHDLQRAGRQDPRRVRVHGIGEKIAAQYFFVGETGSLKYAPGGIR